MRSTKLDKLSIPDECVACVCLNAVPPPGKLASGAPMGVPDFGNWVLHDDPIVELEFWARELGPVFFDLLCVFQPLLYVGSELCVCDSLVVLFGGRSSCPLAPPK